MRYLKTSGAEDVVNEEMVEKGEVYCFGVSKTNKIFQDNKMWMMNV